METISKFSISIVSVVIFCIIIDNIGVIAEGNEWVSKGDALNRMGNFS
jgi:hypothetical protein